MERNLSRGPAEGRVFVATEKTRTSGTKSWPGELVLH